MSDQQQEPEHANHPSHASAQLAPLDEGDFDGIGLRRIKRAYEQIADQLRQLILIGRLKPGMRLATEQELANQLGVSRATVREALKLLTAEGLVRTAKGTGGGTFVTQPTVDRISSYLSANIGLLSDSNKLSLAEFLEARAVLEVPAARLAAVRRTEKDAARLHDTVPKAPQAFSTSEQFVFNRDFHSTIVDICANTLLSLAAQPIFVVLQTRLARSVLDEAFHEAIHRHHGAIARAIAEGDAERAASEMASHLDWLRPAYERAWRDTERD